ncbi:hypothetical protein CRG98_000414 [Punica granatum]|uniref:Sieve element occlusion N-terminal domain-containing protein n=1 Tax=Punica granatum TaxID=22663 RepID=A0A2I0LEL7_PUNGR|nr:hypothetical protein CRG98_000414 [Punica granatum]
MASTLQKLLRRANLTRVISTLQGPAQPHQFPALRILDPHIAQPGLLGQFLGRTTTESSAQTTPPPFFPSFPLGLFSDPIYVNLEAEPDADGVIYSTNQLAKSMAILKQLPVIMKQSGPLKPKFDALNNLIKAMLEVTWCVLQLKELPSPYISHDDPALSAAMSHVPTAVYWTIRSAVACATQITALTSMGHESVKVRVLCFSRRAYPVVSFNQPSISDVPDSLTY